MQRRQVLAALGTSTALAVAGCLSGDTGAQDGTTTPTETPTTTPDDSSPAEDFPGWNPDADEPFETFSVGSRGTVPFPNNNRAIDIQVWNDADVERTMTLTLDSEAGPGLDTEVTFPADGWVKLVANEPAEYTLDIAIDGSTAGEVSISRSHFDCNATSTNVVVMADGEVASRTISTLVGCPGPTVAGRSFSFEPGSCNMDDDGVVSFEDESVIVEGSVRTPNPCYGLELASVELRKEEEFEDGTDDVLEVTVATTEQQADVCTSCVGSVPYTATVEMDDEYPSNVRVVHDSMDEERTVTTVSR